MANGDDDETLKLRVVYEASPAVKEATTDLGKLKEETSALAAVMATLDTKVDEVDAGFKEFYADTTGLTSVLNTLEIQVDEVGIGFAGLAAPVAIADEAFDDLTKTVVRTTGAGSGDSGVGGFAGLTKNIFMAERALTALGTGHGIARVGPMLEKLIGSAGGPAGVGMGIAGLAFLLETIGPKVKKFLESWAEASGLIETKDLVKEIADEMERALKAAEALEKTPSVAQARTKAAVGKAITEMPGGMAGLESQIEMGLAQTTQLEEYMTPAERERYQALPREGLTPEFVAAEQEKILVKARAKRAKRAEAWAGQLGTDRASRDLLRQLPAGIIGRGFLTELGMAEPEYQAELKQLTEGEKGAGKEMGTWRTQRKQEIKAQKEWDQGVNRQGKTFDQWDKEDEKETEKALKTAADFEAQMQREDTQKRNKAQRDAAHAQHEKQRQDREYERKHTPQAIGRAREEREQGAFLGAVQQYAPNEFPDIQKMAAKHARENFQTGFDASATMQQALDYAIMQARDDFNRGIAAGMKRQTSYGEMR